MPLVGSIVRRQPRMTAQEGGAMQLILTRKGSAPKLHTRLVKGDQPNAPNNRAENGLSWMCMWAQRYQYYWWLGAIVLDTNRGHKIKSSQTNTGLQPRTQRNGLDGSRPRKAGRQHGKKPGYCCPALEDISYPTDIESTSHERMPRRLSIGGAGLKGKIGWRRRR